MACLHLWHGHSASTFFSSLLLSSLELSNTKEYEPQIRLNPRPKVLKAEHTLAGGCRESEHTHGAVVDSWRVMATTPQPKTLSAERKLLNPWQVGAEETPERWA